MTYVCFFGVWSMHAWNLYFFGLVRTANIFKQTKLYIILLIYIGACKITWSTSFWVIFSLGLRFLAYERDYINLLEFISLGTVVSKNLRHIWHDIISLAKQLFTICIFSLSPSPYTYCERKVSNFLLLKWWENTIHVHVFV